MVVNCTVSAIPAAEQGGARSITWHILIGRGQFRPVAVKVRTVMLGGNVLNRAAIVNSSMNRCFLCVDFMRLRTTPCFTHDFFLLCLFNGRYFWLTRSNNGSDTRLIQFGDGLLKIFPFDEFRRVIFIYRMIFSL